MIWTYLAPCVVIICCVLTAECYAQATRTIDVQIQTASTDGTAVGDVPVQVVSYEGAVFGMTDALGQLSLAVEAPTGESRIVTRVWNGRFHDLEPSNREHAQAVWDSLSDQYAFKESYVDIDDTSSSYNATITMLDAVRLSGRLVDGTGTPVVMGSVHLLGWSAPSELVFEQAGGLFDLGGVPKGYAVEVILQVVPSGQIHYLLLDSTQTLLDVTLGDIVIEDDEGEGRVQLQLQNWDNVFDDWMSVLNRQVGFVSTDGQRVFGFYMDESRMAVERRWEDPPELPHLPAGEYYIAPGGFQTRPGVALLRSVIAGRQSALNAAGVPRVTVTAGNTSSLNMDVAGARDAILSVGDDLVD